VLTRLQLGFGYWRLSGRLERILEMPPARLVPGGVTVLSQVRDRDMLMYLLAAKSFARQVDVDRFTVLDDGTLSREDRDAITEHVPGVTITPIADIDCPGTPRGNCWERLHRVVELAESAYVIQLDADTVTLGGLPEVAEHIRRGTAFTLCSESDAGIVPLAQAADYAARRQSDHIQILAERALGGLDPAIGTRYARACAAFTGFPPGTWRRETMQRFSRYMTERLGARWASAWGTDQVTSNFLTANSPQAGLLPSPRYCDYVGRPISRDSGFLHFIGTYRFKNGAYRDTARRVIDAMAAASSG
jgi:hypothetical protein